MANTHKLKGWNPGHEPEVHLCNCRSDKAHVYIDGEGYYLPFAWIKPLGDNTSSARSTESDER